MNPRHRVLQLFTLAFSCLATCAVTHGAFALEAGQYEVSVRLELPHVEDSGAASTVTICVEHRRTGTHGLKVLSDNNPLGKCPASQIEESAGKLEFRIVCPGGNAAVASAVYRLSRDAFNGVISMKMGGKNMTMTERQSGRRAGDCRAHGMPRS